jgi:dTDP-4-amino-4,6-dideoxygalactose transaminase
MIPYDGWDREYQENKEAYLAIFDKAMTLPNYENTERFEKDFGEYIGRKYVVGVATATDALYYSLLAHNVKEGDEVLVTDFSWISSSSCISMAKATPVFCDIDLDSYHISLDSIKRMRTEKTKALIYTHLFGNMTDTTDILSYCKEHNIAFIEDSAQSLGSSLNGVRAGTIGDCSSFSFNTNKVVAGINGGGVFMTDDKAQADFVKKVRRHGKGSDFEMIGYNSRLFALNSEIIKFRLQNNEKYQLIRQQNAWLYNESLRDLPIVIQSSSPNLNHNYHKYVVRFNDKETRDRVKNALSLSVHYDKPLSMNSMYNNIHCRKDSCINSKIASDTVLSLPIHAWLTFEEISTIINGIATSI